MKRFAQRVKVYSCTQSTVTPQAPYRRCPYRWLRQQSTRPQEGPAEVAYGDTLAEDLARRNSTVNAMGVALPAIVVVDPHGGLAYRFLLELRVEWADDRGNRDASYGAGGGRTTRIRLGVRCAKPCTGCECVFCGGDIPAQIGVQTGEPTTKG